MPQVDNFTDNRAIRLRHADYIMRRSRRRRRVSSSKNSQHGRRLRPALVDAGRMLHSSLLPYVEVSYPQIHDSLNTPPSQDMIISRCFTPPPYFATSYAMPPLEIDYRPAYFSPIKIPTKCREM